MKNDFAIILLQNEVSLSERINVIPLPIEDISCPIGKPFVASGWGMDRYRNPDTTLGKVPFTRFLQAVNQDCLDIKECVAYGDDDPSLVFCVGDREKPQNSACKGDSGGKCTIKEY